MMTHHVVHESFKNNISNNAHNIAQGGHPVFREGKWPPPPLLNATLPSDSLFRITYFICVKVSR